MHLLCPDRQTDTQSVRHTVRQTDIERHKGRHTDRYTVRQTHIERQTDTQSGRQTDTHRETDTQTHRQTNSLADRQTHIERQSVSQSDSQPHTDIRTYRVLGRRRADGASRALVTHGECTCTAVTAREKVRSKHCASTELVLS